MAKASNRHRKRSTLNPYMRGKIMGARDFGISFTKIAAKYKLPRSTVSGVVYRDQDQENGATSSRNGRPRSMSSKDERHVLRFLRRRPHTSYSTLLAEVPAKFSLSTLQRFLRRKQYVAWMAKKRPYLTAKDAKRRFQWAIKHKKKSKNFWSKVMWTDECLLRRGAGSDKMWMKGTRGQRLKKDYVQTYHCPNGLGVMVWAGFHRPLTTIRRSNLICMMRDVKSANCGYSSRSFLSILSKEVVPKWKHGQILMMDNAPIHRAKKIKNYLKKNNISVMEWPAYSPDLNPIENIWWRLKNTILKLCPESALFGNNKTDCERFENVAKEAWKAIPNHVFAGCLNSMPRRVQAVIAAKGWYTKY